MSLPDASADRYISPHNFDPAIREQMRLPDQVLLNDLTLREGRQVEGLVVTPPILQRVAQELEQAGIRMVQLHHTQEHIEAIGALNMNMRTEVLTRSPYQAEPFTVAAQKDRIDFVLSHGLGLTLCFGTSDQLLLARQARIGPPLDLESLRERELDAAVQCVKHTKQQGGVAGVNLQDFLRADYDFLCRLCTELEDAGVDLITLDDFAAPAIPVVYRTVFMRLKEVVPSVPLGVHVTNDFGLGTALVLAAFEGGAEVLDVGVNSYGERGGHADLAEVATAVSVFYGMDPGVPLAGLTPLSHSIAEILGFEVPTTKPLVGRNAFADVTDTHYIYEGYPWVFRAVAAEMVGNKNKAALAGVSGVAVIQAKARELGLELDIDQCRHLLKPAHNAMAKRRGPITDEEFLTLAREVV